jgi:hypothetical protein
MRGVDRKKGTIGQTQGHQTQMLCNSDLETRVRMRYLVRAGTYMLVEPRICVFLLPNLRVVNGVVMIYCIRQGRSEAHIGACDLEETN